MWQGTGVYTFTNMVWRRENYLKSIFLKRILINYTILVWNIGNNIVYNYRYLFRRNMPYSSYENDLKKGQNRTDCTHSQNGQWKTEAQRV